MTTPVLTTERLILRPLSLADAPRIQENFSDWEIVKYMAATIPWPYPPDGARSYIENVALPSMASGKKHEWAITLKDDPHSLHIGSITLYPQSLEDSRGFWMGRAYQGNGYMKEAMAAVNDFAFETLGMERLMLNNAEPNLGSHRLKEISGAKIVSADTLADYVSGQHNEIRWLLTREDWRANRHKFVPG